jgi:hypothetical protein
MRKRKSPVLLISLLVLLGSGIAIFGFNFNKPDAQPGDDAKPPEQAESTSQPAPSKDEISKNMGLTAQAPKKLGTIEAPKAPGAVDQPSIFTQLPKSQQKPQADLNNAPQGQWYKR